MPVPSTAAAVAGGLPDGGRARGAGKTPLAGASLTLIPLAGCQVGRSVTRADGSYGVDAPGAGSYVLIASADGYQPQATTVVVGDEPVAFDILLSGTSGLTGVVRSADSRAPVADAAVIVTDVRGDVLANRTPPGRTAARLTSAAVGGRLRPTPASHPAVSRASHQLRSPAMSVTRHRGLTEQAADAAIDAACRNLRLPTMRGQFSELADAAVRDQMTCRGFLAELLMAECDDRNRRRCERRIKAAGFPARRHCAPSSSTRTTPSTRLHPHPGLVRLGPQGLPLCLIGDSGTGKSHLLISLGTEAAMAGFRVKYVLATKLVNELVEAADEKALTETIARYGRVDLLCIDELGLWSWTGAAPSCCSRF